MRSTTITSPGQPKRNGDGNKQRMMREMNAKLFLPQVKSRAICISMESSFAQTDKVFIIDCVNMYERGSLRRLVLCGRVAVVGVVVICGRLCYK